MGWEFVFKLTKDLAVLRRDSGKNPLQNTARDSGSPAEWKSTRKHAMMRHLLGASRVGTLPKWHKTKKENVNHFC
jgi:hypothetical protein